MKKQLFATVMMAVLTWGASAQSEPPLDTVIQKFSYGLGLQMGQNLRQQGLAKVDAAAIALAIQDVLAGRGPRISSDEMRTAVNTYRDMVVAEHEAAAERNKSAGLEFLEENRDEDGVVALDSGVQYRVVESGSGAKPAQGDKVVVHYRGWLLNGTEFDSSFRRGEPTELGVGQVIPGWQEALMLMHVGDKWEVWIPAELAYGERGAGAAIGPNETLRFHIELIEVKAGS